MSLLFILKILYLNFHKITCFQEEISRYNYYQLIEDFSFDEKENKKNINNFILYKDAEKINNSIIKLTNKNNLSSYGSIIYNKTFNTSIFQYQTKISFHPKNENSSFFSIFFLSNFTNSEINFNTLINGFGFIFFTDFRFQYRTLIKLVFAKNEKIFDVIYHKKFLHNNCLEYNITERKLKIEIYYDFLLKHIYLAYDTPFKLEKMCLSFLQNDEKIDRTNFLENSNFKIAFFSSNFEKNFSDLINKKNVTLQDNIFIYKQRVFNLNKDYKNNFIIKEKEKKDNLNNVKINEKSYIKKQENIKENAKKNLITIFILILIIVFTTILFKRIKNKEKII